MSDTGFPGPQLADVTGPLEAGVVGVGPGRVVWNDDTSATLPLRQRTLSGSGGGLTMGNPTQLAASSTGYGDISVSGRMTAFFDSTEIEPVEADLRLAVGSQVVTLAPNTLPGEVTLSGFRLLHVNRLYDLNAKKLVNLPGTNVADYALWGNYLAYSVTDGSVWRKDISSSAPAVRVRAPSPVAERPVYATVKTAGDFVAWSIAGNCSPSCLDDTAYRNAATLTPAVQVTAGYSVDPRDTRLALSSSYLVKPYVAAGDNGWDTTLIAVNLATGVQSTVTTSGVFDIGLGVLGYGVSGSRVAWIGNDGLAHVGDLPHVVEPPRYLGNGIAPPSLAAGHSWRAEFVASAAMPTCAVVIRSGSTVVRTLDCGNTMGDAAVVWDGKDALGATLPAGDYVWTLTGSNGDGSLLNADGTSTAVTGIITKS